MKKIILLSSILIVISCQDNTQKHEYEEKITQLKNELIKCQESVESKKLENKLNEEKANKEKANKEKANKEKANKEKANKEKANKEKANKEKANKEKANKEKAAKNIKKEGWETDLNKAISISQQTNKDILLFFTGSDWCGWCKKLVREVFNKPIFKDWADKNVVLVELDFPRRTKLDPKLQQQNRKLQQDFGVRGYPTIWFVSTTLKDGNNVTLAKLGSIGYVDGGPTNWISQANKILSK